MTDKADEAAEALIGLITALGLVFTLGFIFTYMLEPVKEVLPCVITGAIFVATMLVIAWAKSGEEGRKKGLFRVEI